ncbi:MAG: M48 family metallopeptidase [Bacteroidetes bacterium]|nr:M48 family metallopeptidase [Bacteroidota bacterium]MCW5894714.1 M48 family metallopeptidase [Bacteroidota bacterium]
MTSADPAKAKQYSRTKLVLGITSSALSFALLLVIVLSGVSVELRNWAHSLFSLDYAAIVLFLLALGIMQSFVTLPIGFYSGFIVEHRYNLSNQTFGRWVWERVKGLLVGAPLMLAVVLVLYYCLKTYGEWWWLPVSIALTFFSLVLARIVPTFIMPLFYRFTPIESGSLKERIMNLCEKAGVRIDGIFSFNMSKNTKKANAGFTGIGKSKRIILGDTLMQEFSEEEIETVFAHELGHYTHKHILIGIAVGMCSTFAGLYVTSKLYALSLGWFGFASVADVAALPILGLWLSVFGLVTSPLGNVLSRKHEREADRYAVTTTKNKHAFISALLKLADTNLADPEPHPVIEFLFYSHPSIARRIALVESLN